MILRKNHVFQVTLILAGITNIACLAKALAMSNGRLFNLGTDVGSVVLVCSSIAILLIVLGLINFKTLPVSKQKKQWVRFFLVLNSPSALLLGAEALMLFLIFLYVMSRIRPSA